jgi:hypothetical protein
MGMYVRGEQYGFIFTRHAMMQTLCRLSFRIMGSSSVRLPCVGLLSNNGNNARLTHSRHEHQETRANTFLSSRPDGSTALRPLRISVLVLI